MPSKPSQNLLSRQRHTHEKSQDKMLSQSQKKVFSSMTLNKGSIWSESVVDDEVFFPNLIVRKKKVAKQTKCKKEKRSKEDISTTMFTDASSQRQEQKLDNMWMFGFIHHSKTTDDNHAKKTLNRLLRLPDSSVLPAASKQMTNQIKHSALDRNYNSMNTRNIDNNHSSDPKSNLTLKERERLDELARRLNVNNIQSSKHKVYNNKKKAGVIQRKPLIDTKAKIKDCAMNPYHKTNIKLNKLLHGKIKLFPGKEEIKSHSIQQVMKINQLEVMAALILQKNWRRYLSIEFMKLLAIKHKVAKILQPVVRGMLVRIWFHEHWKPKILQAIILIQASIRQYFTYKEYCQLLLKRLRSAIIVQKYVRSYINRIHFQEQILNIAVTRVQTFWRSKFSRSVYIKLKRNIQATKIQSIVRSIQTRCIHFVYVRQRKFKAATIIQCCWRFYLSRIKQRQMLYQRDMEQIQDQVRLIESEHRYWDGKATKLLHDDRKDGKSSHKERLRNQYDQLSLKGDEYLTNVKEKEDEFDDLISQLSNLTPILIDQGWDKHLEHRIRRSRIGITQKKLGYIFNVKRHLHETKTVLDMVESDLAHAKNERDLWFKWREEEIETIWEIERKELKERELIEKRKKIANEKRKWAIPLTNENGKPYKKEKNSSWLNSANTECGRFSYENVDIFASIQPTEENHHGNAYVANNLIEQIKLEKYNTDIQRQNGVWKPHIQYMQQKAESMQELLKQHNNKKDERNNNTEMIVDELNPSEKENFVVSEEAQIRNENMASRKTYLLRKLQTEKEKLDLEKSRDKFANCALKANALMNQSPLTFSNEGQHSIEPKGAASLDTLDNLAKTLESRLDAIERASRGIAQRKWDNALQIQGGSLKTWTYSSAAVERVQVSLKTGGRPLDADIDLWQGPDNTPCKMRVYIEDGNLREFNAVIETPRAPNTVAVSNIGHLEFPMEASVVANNVDGCAADLESAPSRIIQGGALQTYPFDPTVESVQIVLQTDGRPLNSRIELLQGPNNNKQVMEVYTEDGKERPFYAIIDTPGSGNIIRIVNTSPVEFPLRASVGAYKIGTISYKFDPVIGGDS